jgi:hypothetical protein
LIQFAKIAVLVSVWVALFVFVPQQLQGDVFLFEFFEQVLHGRHDRFVRCRLGDAGIKALFETGVIDVIGKRPGDPGLPGHLQVLSHSDVGDGAAFGDITVSQLVVEFEPEHFFEFSHG